jgi:8-amino-7-oxononanoate synthase/acyl carrier protein
MSVGSKGNGDSTSAIAEVVFDQVRRALPEGLSCDIALDSSLYDIGLDSLTRMEVVNRLEEAFNMRFTEDALFEMETCADLVQYIESKQTSGNPGEPAEKATLISTRVKVPANVDIRPEHHDVTRFPECVAFHQRVAGMEDAGFENPFFRVNEKVENALATIDGRQVVSYASFDYLGMASDPRVVQAAKDAIDQFGTSASASRLVGGDNTLLQELDEELAQFLGTEEALVLPSGYGTNASLIGHLFGPDDLILYDELAHNSMVQGTVLSRAQRRAFPHNDVEFLDGLLRDLRSQHRRAVIAIEGLYSMDGDYPDLPKFLEVKSRHKALLYVDEAHSAGVLGATGRGICEHYGVDPNEGDIWMGTISKALGSGGGFIAGRKELTQFLKYTTPALVFATAPSPANAAAALTALRLLRAEPQRVARLRDRSQLFLKLARDCGLNTGTSNDTPIIPIILGDSQRCIEVSAALLRAGVNARPILYPAVPEDASRIRFFINADHTEEQICRTVELLNDCLGASHGTT